MITRIILVVFIGLLILGYFYLDDKSKYRKYLEVQKRRRELAAAVKRQKENGRKV